MRYFTFFSFFFSPEARAIAISADKYPAGMNKSDRKLQIQKCFSEGIISKKIIFFPFPTANSPILSANTTLILRFTRITYSIISHTLDEVHK
jgi:hypothetical protein